MKNNKQRFVFWSGGLDSTYLIYHYLKQGFSVTAGYVKVQNNAAKVTREMAAIEKMKPIFERMFPKQFYHYGVHLDVTLNQMRARPLFTQPPIWMLASLFVPETIGIGYVMNDDMISFLDDFKDMITALNKFRSDDQQLVVEFPLTKMHKNNIMCELPEEFWPLVTWCESPNDEDDCGKCVPCRKMISIDKPYQWTRLTPAPVIDPEQLGEIHSLDAVKDDRLGSVEEETVG